MTQPSECDDDGVEDDATGATSGCDKRERRLAGRGDKYRCCCAWCCPEVGIIDRIAGLARGGDDGVRVSIARRHL